MLTRIGKPAAAGDAVDLLLECHERIRAFLALARRIAEADAPNDAALRDAALRVHRYFSEALPLHAEDEEESILPRLRGLDPEVDAALERMVREHAEHERPLGALTAACREIARAARPGPELQATVGRSMAELERPFDEHLSREESVVFPAMRRLFGRSVDDAIVREIRKRRGAVGPLASRER